MKAVNIFFCYARKDELLRQELEKQLKSLKRQGLIAMWHDRNITAGTEWEREIRLQLNLAQIILLLVSPDFMESDYCYSREMAQAMDRHERSEARVVPVILRPVLWQDAPFGKLQALPRDGKPVTDSTSWKDQDAAFLSVADGIRKVVEYLNVNPLVSPIIPPELIEDKAPKVRTVITPEMIRSSSRSFYGSDMHGLDFHKADLRGVDLHGANLTEVDFTGANLSRADLRGADLYRARFVEADLTKTNLRGADLTGADLTGADLYEANLVETNLTGTKLIGTDFSNAIMGWTLLGGDDVRLIKGLETVDHTGPSEISVSTFYRSEGEIPETFLRGTGIPDTMIEYIPSLVRLPIEYYTCIIYHSKRDTDFVARLFDDLQNKGVRCRSVAGDQEMSKHQRTRIDESFHVYEKLIVVLSKNFVESLWAEQWWDQEFAQTLAKEQTEKRSIFFPVQIDDTVSKSAQEWIADIYRMRYISDFTHWKDQLSYQKAFKQLLFDLKADSKRPEM